MLVWPWFEQPPRHKGYKDWGAGASFRAVCKQFCGKNRPGKHLGQAGAYVTWCLEFRFF